MGEDAMRPDRDDDLNSFPASQKPVLLLVEDEVLIRFDLADYLRECGFMVLEAASVDEAEAFFTAGIAIDAVFSDIRLLGPRDGVELALWIGSHFPEVPVVLTSGVHRALGAAKARGAHIVDFIDKPYDPVAVAQRMRELVARRDVVGS
jgi:DNA-binding NtrC family response regulator